MTATARSLNAAASGDAFLMARSAIAIAGGSAHVASRGVDAVAGEDIDIEFSLKLKLNIMTDRFCYGSFSRSSN